MCVCDSFQDQQLVLEQKFAQTRFSTSISFQIKAAMVFPNRSLVISCFKLDLGLLYLDNRLIIIILYSQDYRVIWSAEGYLKRHTLVTGSKLFCGSLQRAMELLIFPTSGVRSNSTCILRRSVFYRHMDCDWFSKCFKVLSDWSSSWNQKRRDCMQDQNRARPTSIGTHLFHPSKHLLTIDSSSRDCEPLMDIPSAQTSAIYICLS